MAAWRPRSSGEPTGVGAMQSGSTYLFSRAAVTRVAFRVSPKMRAESPKGCLEAYVNLVIGMVAMFNRPVKRVSYFLDAIPTIVRAVPSARFLIVGRGKDEQSLRDKAKALGIEPYVVFAGYREDVGRYYAIMDISVLSSLSEGLSITLLESMNHGLPVVVTRVGGNPEVVVDGQTGYLVPPRDARSFAERVVQLLRNPVLRARMGQEGRKRIEVRFQIRDVVQRYLAVYRELVEPETSG